MCYDDTEDNRSPAEKKSFRDHMVAHMERATRVVQSWPVNKFILSQPPEYRQAFNIEAGDIIVIDNGGYLVQNIHICFTHEGGVRPKVTLESPPFTAELLKSYEELAGGIVLGQYKLIKGGK